MGTPFFEDGATFGFLLKDERRDSYQGELYKGKIVVLIDEQTQSAAEGAAGNFAKARPDTIFIGGSTAGANGDTSTMILPGNIKVSFTGHKVLRYDGQQLQRVGIEPTVKVAPTIKGLVDGKDEILAAAVNFLKN